ncbi:DUF3750 domain-containing protein [Anderseniella sp. Alg231-50]|uniref:DUF3750 domain-containing protein n=1 Tax=Anderseniella sp. Alg231-50 TaxID=1922226 RepID=UPI000D553B2F
MLRRLVKFLSAFAIVLIALPIAAGAAYSYAKGWPSSWRSADWSSSGLLPEAATDEPAAIYIMAARSGRWKGIFAVHHWLVIKPAGASEYERFEVVGWGSPVRHNAYAPDGRWYSNEPYVVHEVHGAKAEALLPKVITAARIYEWSAFGDYVVWPGPNSNTFIASIAREVPELGAELDPAGVGKDWLGPGLRTGVMPSGTGIQISYDGYIGVGISRREGIELHVLGATIGVDFDDLAIKLPALGKIGLR